MIRCLDDRVLLLAAIGEGSTEQCAHLASCRSCSSRYAELEGDLDVLHTALRGVPPRLTRAPSSHYSDRLWMASLAVAAIVTLIVALQWLRRTAGTELARVGAAPSATIHSRDAAALSAYAEEVSAAMFDTATDRRLSSGIFDVATRDSGQKLTPDVATLQEALEAGPVCTGGRFIDGECNDYVSALFF
jgi:hypothetical protein